MPAERGHTLIEMLIAVAVSAVVAGGLFTLLGQMQQYGVSLSRLAEQSENLRLAPLLLVQWIAPAGSARTPAESGNADSVQIGPQRIAIRSDIDGAMGFPDGTFESSFEEIQLRGTKAGLSLKSGRGSLQPILRLISDFQVEAPAEELVSVTFEGDSDPLPVPLQPEAPRHRMDVFLWNRHENLFAK